MPTPMLNFRLGTDDVALLDQLAAEDKTTRAGVVRALLRAEAERRAERAPPRDSPPPGGAG